MSQIMLVGPPLKTRRQQRGNDPKLPVCPMGPPFRETPFSRRWRERRIHFDTVWIPCRQFKKIILHWEKVAVWCKDMKLVSHAAPSFHLHVLSFYLTKNHVSAVSCHFHPNPQNQLPRHQNSRILFFLQHHHQSLDSIGRVSYSTHSFFITTPNITSSPRSRTAKDFLIPFIHTAVNLHIH